MNEVIKTFMERDRLTKKEAVYLYKAMLKDIEEIILNGGGYTEVEEYLMDEGFEMDYFLDFV